MHEDPEFMVYSLVFFLKFIEEKKTWTKFQLLSPKFNNIEICLLLCTTKRLSTKNNNQAVEKLNLDLISMICVEKTTFPRKKKSADLPNGCNKKVAPTILN